MSRDGGKRAAVAALARMRLVFDTTPNLAPRIVRVWGRALRCRPTLLGHLVPRDENGLWEPRCACGCTRADSPDVDEFVGFTVSPGSMIVRQGVPEGYAVVTVLAVHLIVFVGTVETAAARLLDHFFTSKRCASERARCTAAEARAAAAAPYVAQALLAYLEPAR